ncbi:MAG: response regulator [Proteobacteria bacterium]|nr:response regulator [Pseudomonadota bacterium]
MPEMGGKKLLQKLKGTDLNVKVLGITGYVTETFVEELREAGFLDLIHKPFGIEAPWHK